MMRTQYSPTDVFVDRTNRLVDSRLAERRGTCEIATVMFEFEYLTAQARKCRTLAGGLSNREDVRKLEELARELEERARLAELAGQPASHAITL
jgi:hypothetical protein